MINREKREQDDLQRLTPELRRSLNKGLKQFCITSGSSVIKHSMKLEGENERQAERGEKRGTKSHKWVQTEMEGATEKEKVLALNRRS